MGGKVNRILQEAQKVKSRGWLRVGIKGMVPTVDPSAPPMYRFDVQGERGDGVVFTVPVYINKAKIDLVPPQEIVRAVGALINEGIQRLMVFSSCGCTATVECEQHKKPMVN
jgi:hypothetical protein